MSRARQLTPTKALTDNPARRSLFGSPKKPKVEAPKTIQQKIKAAFYDPKSGLWSVDKVYKKLKANGVKVTLKQVKQVLENQLVTQVYKPQPKYKKQFTTIKTSAPREQYQVDLIDLTKYSKFNKGYKWMFNAVDVYSRYAFSVPTKTKDNDDCVAAFRKIMDVMGKPVNLNTDLEKAILGNEFQAMLKKNGIKHWPVDPERKRTNSIVERFNRTIRSVLQKYFYTRDTKNWVDILPDLLQNYNSTVHTTTKQRPVDVWNGEAENEQKVRFPKFTIKIGDKVRILKRHGEFTKKSDVKIFTKNIYTVKAIEGTTFIVENEKKVQQRRRDYELQKVDAAAVTTETFEPKGEGKEFKKELKKQRAQRRLNKEDIKTDLVGAAPAAEKRVSKPVLPKQTPKKQKKPPVKKKPKFAKGMRVSVKYPDQTYTGTIDEVFLTPRGAIEAVDVDFDDGTSTVIEKALLRFIKVLK